MSLFWFIQLTHSKFSPTLVKHLPKIMLATQIMIAITNAVTGIRRLMIKILVVTHSIVKVVFTSTILI